MTRGLAEVAQYPATLNKAHTRTVFRMAVILTYEEISVSEIKLSDNVAVDPSSIESVKLLKRGAKIEGGITAQLQTEAEELTAPEDELIVVLKDGTEFAIRGEREAAQAWAALEQARSAGNAAFQMTRTGSR